MEAAGIQLNTTRLIIKTRNSKLWKNEENCFCEDFVAISPDGAEWIVAYGIQLIGVDYLSVVPYKDSTIIHQILLKAGVVILEGVNLNGIGEGFYDLYCLPLNLVGSDGAPARVVLIER